MALLRTREVSYWNIRSAALFIFLCSWEECRDGTSKQPPAAAFITALLFRCAAANATLLQRGIHCTALHEIVLMLFSEDNVTLRSHMSESENVPVDVRLKLSLFLQNQLNWYRNMEQSQLDIFYWNMSGDTGRVTITFHEVQKRYSQNFVNVTTKSLNGGLSKKKRDYCELTFLK
jgi:hypothetical protein